MNTQLCILVTRPDPEGHELCQQIQAQGDLAIQFPTIAIAPPRDRLTYNKMINELGQQDWLIFISPQSVYASIPDIRRAWPNFPSQTKFAAIGEGTARALEKAGYINTLYPDKLWNSEGLLALSPFQKVRGERITIIRGEGGRELLEQTLSERGAHVMSLICYRRVLPTLDVLPYLILLRENRIDLIICTSGDSVINLKKLTGDADLAALQKIPLLVVSERIKMLAEDLGFQTIWVAPNAKHETLVNALGKIRNKE